MSCTRFFSFFVIAIVLRVSFFSPVYAQQPVESTIAAELTATASATVSAQPEKEKPIDITQTTTEVKSQLASYVEGVQETPLRPWNVLQHAIKSAVQQGVPANILVLLLLFPVTASMIAVFRHIIGLRGFGVHTPAVLAVAFLSLGITRGLILFLFVFAAVLIGKWLINFVHVPYLPRTALMLWFVSVMMFLLFAFAPYLGITDFASVGIFPLLMIVLLSEHFMEAQFSANVKHALQLTLETIALAIASALFMRTFEVQQFVVLYPEVTIAFVFLLNVVVGKYTGLRVAEFFRFKALMDPEE